MARIFSQPMQDYAAGTYGPFKVDGLTRADTRALLLTFTVESWPGGEEPLVSGQMRWNTGAGADFQFGGTTPVRGDPLVRTVEVEVPRSEAAGGKVEVADGTLTVTVHRPFRCAVKLEALGL